MSIAAQKLTTGSSTTGSSTTGSSTTGSSNTGSSTGGSETNPQTISGPDTITMCYGDTNANIGASAPGTLRYTVNAGSAALLDVDANGNLTAKADDKSAYVGDQAPALTFTVKGLIGNDKLTTDPTVSYASNPDMSKTGTVTINVSGAVAPNYDITYQTGTLTITNRPTGGGGGGGGGGFVEQTYDIVVNAADNGVVKSDRSSAAAGTTINLTVTPNIGYVLSDLVVTDAKDNTLKLTDKGDGKYTFVMPSSKVTVKSSFAPASGDGAFVDVKSDDFFYDAVQWAVDNKVTTGTSATTFDPNGICTRAQAVTFLWRSAGCPAPTSTTMAFTDVPAGSFYYDAVLWAIESGITKGTSTTTFSPNDTCNRGQIVTFLYRAMKSPEANATNPFQDVAADAYYADAVLWAVEKGVTTGTSATTFSPNADGTRSDRDLPLSCDEVTHEDTKKVQRSRSLLHLSFFFGSILFFRFLRHICGSPCEHVSLGPFLCCCIHEQ